ncbi:MAG: sigma-70 family RNA polymerase sigma factor [Deltaproteobacteria bacterium]|nr:sigma-70 family RNA polymerase sigma factor [Deltaproteobacteria bacterium]MBN2670646.1 sigma-70 family RNA polymerase sigma factor [Deltaproteobacteria bacterium]
MEMSIKEEAAKLKPLQFQQDDTSLVMGLRAGHVGAGTIFYDKYVRHVQRVVTRVMGVDPELKDITNEVFFQALKSIHSLKEPERLKAWMTQITVFTSRKWIRKRKRKNWLRFFPHEELPEPTVYPDEPGAKNAGKAVRDIIEHMPVEERLIFTLRYMEEMQLSEIAEACGFSIRTAKRRLAQCEKRFKSMAQSDATIATYLEASDKWRNR